MPSKLKRLREEEVEAKPIAGLKDGGHVYLHCSNCRALLADLWRTRPHEPDVWKVRCNCPWCGDVSFITEVQGGFHPAGYGTVKPDDEDDVVPSTNAEFSNIEGDVVVFKVTKANENAKPIYLR